MVNISLKNPRKHGRDLCLTRWKDGGDKDVGWKGRGVLCGVLRLPLLFCGGRSSQIGASTFHCGDLPGDLCGARVER